MTDCECAKCGDTWVHTPDREWVEGDCCHDCLAYMFCGQNPVLISSLLIGRDIYEIIRKLKLAEDIITAKIAVGFPLMI